MQIASITSIQMENAHATIISRKPELCTLKIMSDILVSLYIFYQVKIKIKNQNSIIMRTGQRKKNDLIFC